MQEHGGKMQVESTVGVGTTFRLEFPVTAAAGAGRSVAGPSAEVPAAAAESTATAPVEGTDAETGEPRSMVHV